MIHQINIVQGWDVTTIQSLTIIRNQLNAVPHHIMLQKSHSIIAHRAHIKCASILPDAIVRNITGTQTFPNSSYRMVSVTS